VDTDGRKVHFVLHLNDGSWPLCFPLNVVHHSSLISVKNFNRKYVKEKFIADLRKARDSGKGKEPEEMKRVSFQCVCLKNDNNNHCTATILTSILWQEVGWEERLRIDHFVLSGT